MNPLSQEEIKSKVAAELEITHLAADEQDKIISTLAEEMLKRASVVIMSKMPDSELDEIEALLDGDHNEEVKNRIIDFVPNASQIVDTVIKDGIEEYKQLVEAGQQQNNKSNPKLVQKVEQEIPEQKREVSNEVEEHFVVDESGEAQSTELEQYRDLSQSTNIPIKSLLTDFDTQEQSEIPVQPAY